MFGLQLSRWILHSLCRIITITSWVTDINCALSTPFEAKINAKTAITSNSMEVIGGPENFWLCSNKTGFDLTHPPTADHPAIFPRISLKTTTDPVAIDPSKTALVVIDLENYFLSPALGRPKDAPSMEVVKKLVQSTIPACRKAGIPVVWLNWGLTDDDINTMPPTILKGFGADINFVDGEKRIGSPGEHIGKLVLENGTVIDGGRSLIKNQWNTAQYQPLADKADPAQDIWIYKNRLSGFWGGTGIEDTLKARGIRTLLFSGANTDQCVGGSIQDAFTKGWDCLMLSDACATTSPAFAKEMIEFNMAGGWGFVLTTEQFAEGVDELQPSANAGD